MRVTCPECLTKFNLKPERVSPDGQMMRCGKCAHMWFFHPDFAEPEKQAAAPLAPPAGGSATDKIFAPDEAFPSFSGSGVVADVAAGAADTGSAAAAVFASDIPAAETPAAFIDHQPWGLSAGQFGGLVFAALMSITITTCLVMKQKIVMAYPAAYGIYAMAGVTVEAPGEGMRLSGIKSQIVEQDGTYRLDVAAKLSNIAGRDLYYPSIRVVVRDGNGDALNNWDFHPDKTALKIDETIPVSFSFENAPEGMKTVEMTAIPSP